VLVSGNMANVVTVPHAQCSVTTSESGGEPGTLNAGLWLTSASEAWLWLLRGKECDQPCSSRAQETNLVMGLL
jgi:hypothetical protein